MSESLGWGTWEVPYTAKPPQECELAFQFYYSKPFDFNGIFHKKSLENFNFNINDISDCGKSSWTSKRDWLPCGCTCAFWFFDVMKRLGPYW